MKIYRNRLVYVVSGVFSFIFYLIIVGLEMGRLSLLTKVMFKPLLDILGDELMSVRNDYDPIAKTLVNKIVLALPSFGCEHYFKNGGCGMCGFNNEIERYGFRNLHPWAIIFLVKLILTYFAYEKFKLKEKVNSLTIFMAGSFLNKNELPLVAQNIIFEVFRVSDIKKLIIESRPEYVISSQKRITDYHFDQYDKKLEIAIGLEAMDDVIRNSYINKNISLEVYRQAITAIKNSGAIAATYILIGAPYLSREEIIDSAVATARFAWQCGSDIVNLEAYSVQADTAWQNLYRQNKLAPPSLWTVAEVVKRIDKISSVWYLGEFSDWPEPIAKPTSCPICQNDFLKLLNRLRKEHDIKQLHNLPICSCKPNQPGGRLKIKKGGNENGSQEYYLQAGRVSRCG